ncbi:unnamed protein product, partial [Phaeothamnion confervicola]
GGERKKERAGNMKAWCLTHFDGYDLLAVASTGPSLVLLDASALVALQRLPLPGSASAVPTAVLWQPANAKTGASSGALAVLVADRDGKSDSSLLVFTPAPSLRASRAQYIWRCAGGATLNPLYAAGDLPVVLAWSAQGPLVVAGQSLSVWAAQVWGSENRLTSESTSRHSHGSAGGGGSVRGSSRDGEDGSITREWVAEGTCSYVAAAVSPCGCMIATALELSSEVTVWLREPLGGGAVGYAPAARLPQHGPVRAVSWSLGPGDWQDYILVLNADGKARIWVERGRTASEAAAVAAAAASALRARTGPSAVAAAGAAAVPLSV